MAGKAFDKLQTLKSELAELLGEKEVSRAMITKKIWDYIKENKLQTSQINGKPSGNGRNIVADKKLLSVFKNTNTTSKKGEKIDLSSMKEGETIDMMTLPAIVSANIE